MDEEKQVVRKFNAANHFKENGMTFRKVNEDGTAEVEFEDGSLGDFDPKAYAKEVGVIPAKDFSVSYNTPDEPLNEAPVGALDRLKLSFGNKKGGVNYLRSKFEDATVDAKGDLVVKDKGAWKRVDLDGLGDESGWKVSEMIGDLADVGGDVLVGAGSLAGAGAGMGVGSAALGSAGAGAASAVKNVLGRAAGTYDATPQEFAKDILFDTALGLVGEGVGQAAIKLGSKAMAREAIERGMSKLGKLGEMQQATLARAFSSLDPDTGVGTYRNILGYGDKVVKDLRMADVEAAKRVTQAGANVAEEGVAPMTHGEALQAVLRENMQKAVAPISNTGAIKTALSDYYEVQKNRVIADSFKAGGMAKFGATVRQNGVALANAVDNLLANTGLLIQSVKEVKTPGRIAPIAARRVEGPRGALEVKLRNSVRPDDVLAWANKNGNMIFDKKDAARFAAEVNNLRAYAQGLSNKKVLSGDDVTSLFKLESRLTDRIFESLPAESRELMENKLKIPMESLTNAVAGVMPKKMQDGFKNLTKNYAVHVRNMKKIQGSADGKKSAVTNKDVANNLIEMWKTRMKQDGSQSFAEAQEITESLKSIFPKAGEYLNNLARAEATAAFGGFKAAEALSVSGALARTAAFAGRKVALPVAMQVARFQRRASLKSFLGSDQYKRFAEAATTLKNSGPTMASNSEALSAGLTALLAPLNEQ